ncbi:MAG: BMP family ABC transporter substrate-binding protein [Betaproteobacteria bacterium]|nr:BMP family ABC transporter substrate-binding protein [Betaproteobacteria bacterium]
MSKNLTRRGLLAAAPALAALSALHPRQAWPAPPAGPLQVGFLYPTPLLAAGWSAQHDEGRRHLAQALGEQVRTRQVASVAEGPDAERVLRELVADGCRLIVAASFGYLESVLRVAADHPGTVFEHISGYRATANVGFANARFYEGRYLAGLAAGGVSRSGVAGYVAAFPIPEVVQGINAFALGLRAANPAASLKVIWTQSWHDPGRERDAAQTLLGQGADVLTNHTDSPAVPIAAQAAGRWCVGYHSDQRAFAPEAQLTAVTHHWGEFYTASAQAVIEGRWRNSALWGGVRQGMVRLAPFGAAVPAAVRRQVALRQAELAAGRGHPFAGRLVDNEGRVRQESGTLSDDALARMNWYVQGVQGRLPGG